MSEDKGHLLVPMLHVERNEENRSTRVTVEIPDVDMLGSREEFEPWIRDMVTRLGDEFIHQWEMFTR